ncbi:carbonate dehydratase [uncultured Agitococcus sp.]|uniref:carbonate dehydratase n=1 Tax=uncultured Agitococcus sp. TaxID=1506599 RepID=UPI002636A596|nr:carbonate dehydratase [uncultured Agitococcus sp.]
MSQNNLEHLLVKNRQWAQRIKDDDPSFFQQLSSQQKPRYLWIGCADSRVPCTQLVDLLPGEMFVHRNVANLVIHTDFNCLSVMQYAIDVLQVEHIIVCGHYRCGGIQAALQNQQFGLIDNWLRHVQDVIAKYKNYLDKFVTEQERLDQLCELNVIEQVFNVCENTLVRHAWNRGQKLSVHGWIYGVEDGLLRDLSLNVSSIEEMKSSVHHLFTKTGLI